MPDGPLTLLDLANRSGDNVHAVVDEVHTFAPEWGRIPAVPRLGTSYEVIKRTGLPSGDFRGVGKGVKMTKSTTDRDVKPMFIFDCQINVGEDIVKAQTAQSKANFGEVLADEALQNIRGSAIKFGSQFYYGQKASADGFFGLATQVSVDMSAGGATNTDTTSVYLVYLDPNPRNPQGVHFTVGLDGNMSFGEWQKAQVDKGNNTRATEWWTNFMFYCGLCVSSEKSVLRIKNVKSGNPFTDEAGAELLSKMPLDRKGNLLWLMNANARFLLQKSRAGVAVNQGQGGNFPDVPTSCQGIPILCTDSLVNTERDGNLP